ncbi:MAG TPA: type II secretion system F family protein [Planctomycetota bacterium]|nr:type II secretion system F family protein [Planctomycetota bacterium]
MPIFEYKAFTADGSTKTGVVDADTPRAARQRLRRDNLMVSELAELRGGRRSKTVSASAGGAPKRDSLLVRLMRQRAATTTPSGKNLEFVAAATRQLGTLLGAGIPLIESLRALIEQAENRRAETVFREVRERVSQGVSMADALAEHPGWFSDLYVNMVRAGQATGNLDVVFSRLADYLQAQRALRRKVVSALTYPAMMIAIGVIVVSILMTLVVPKITGMLLDTGQTLPVPTQVLIAVSNGFKDYWWLGLLAIGAVSFVFERVYNRSDAGRLTIDRSLLRLPVIGDLLRKQAVARFTHTLSTLLQSGVPVVASLEITRNVVGNRVLADATEHIRVRILEGTDIATPLRNSGAFPAVVGYMVSVGEQSGELEQMLDRIGAAYDEEIQIATERLTAVLEPIMIVILAVVVGYIVISIVLPILKVGQIQ